MLLMPSTPLNASTVDCNSSSNSSILSSSRGEPEPPAAGVFTLRQLINLALGPLAMAALASGGTKRISLLLSAVVALMIACFATTLIGSGVDADLLGGLVPTIPNGSSELALALIGTTAIPVNLLMGSSIARSSSEVAMRRGVGLASGLSGMISLLVLLVGSHVERPPCVAFALVDVAHVLEAVMGPAGLTGFAIGLFGAGISSALTIPLGTTLALEDLFGLHDPSSDSKGGAKSLASADAAAAVAERSRAPGSPRTALRPMQIGPSTTSGWRKALRVLRWHSWGRFAFIVSFLGLSLIPSLLQLPTITIIMTAQVVNGVLLPCVASMLLISLNDAELMSDASPQSACSNALMFPCVGIALYLASVVLVKRLVTGGERPHDAMVGAVPLAAVGMICLAGCVWVVRGARRHAPMMRTPPRPILRTVECSAVVASTSPPC